MTDARLLPITNTINNSAWGMPGGVAAALGWPATDEIQAEYWLGAHPSAPSRTSDGTTDLATWESENGQHLPFLLKVLTAAKPLSLQAHPTTAQAQEGFARENAAGISLDAFERSYKDPHAKPELIVALTDGFQALCGFRDPQLTANELTELASHAENPEPIFAFRDLLLTRGLREAVAFTLSRTSEVAELVAALVAAGADHPVISAVHESFAGDDGIAFALLLNHVTLAQGECLFLPAGNVHAYMYGSGIELMGPSDNVLRGGLTVKYVDEAELMKTLVFESADAPYLAPLAIAENVATYRPNRLPSGSDVPFELLQVTADATIELLEAAIGLVTDGAFTVQTATASLEAPRGSAFFVTAATTLAVRGSGTLWVAKRAH